MAPFSMFLCIKKGCLRHVIASSRNFDPEAGFSLVGTNNSDDRWFQIGDLTFQCINLILGVL